jgi:hypothetical protein
VNSTSSTEARPPLQATVGAEIGGFRLDRLIGRGSSSAVYEATQLSLDRRVALKLVPPDPDLARRFRRLRWPDHRNVVPMYAAGVSEQGQFVAMQLVDGRSLGELLRARELSPARLYKVLADVAAALDAAHRDGIVHGAVTAGNVLIDRGARTLVSDFGLGSGTATAASDRATFCALVADCLGGAGDPEGESAAAILGPAPHALPPVPRRRRRGAIAAGACGVVIAAAGLVALDRGGHPATGPPAILRGASVLGSRLPSAGMRTVDCDGSPPSGASRPCSLVQERLSGRPVIATRGGVVRRWAVRGARGQVALQVVHAIGKRYTLRARTPYVTVADQGVHAFDANLPVRPGDRVGLGVAPGAAVGVRRVRGAATERWFGPLVMFARPPERGAGTGFDVEVLLRVEYVPGATVHIPGVLIGRAAARAPAGRALASRDLEAGGGRLRTVTAVRLPGRIALDLFDGRRRLVRLPVSDLDPAGSLLNLSLPDGHSPRIDWSNPNGQAVRHDYDAGASSLLPRD